MRRSDGSPPDTPRVRGGTHLGPRMPSVAMTVGAVATLLAVLPAVAAISAVAAGSGVTGAGDSSGPPTAATAEEVLPGPTVAPAGAEDLPTAWVAKTRSDSRERSPLSGPSEGIRFEFPRALATEAAALAAGTAPPKEHEFSLTRAVYSGGGFRRRGAWATDFPKADRQFLYIIGRMLRLLDVNPDENAVLLTDPDLRKFPFLYALEVGSMYLSPEEITALRDYVEAGGFLMIDDFWGSREWANFEFQMRQVFPDRSIEPIPMDHEIFHTFYDIEEVLQVPSINNARYGQYWERDGYTPYVRGIFDEFGDLMVIINWNTDLGDAWEWSESPDYPFDRSSYAYQMAINTIMYAMSH